MKSYGMIATICLSMHMCEALNIGNFITKLFIANEDILELSIFIWITGLRYVSRAIRGGI